MIEFLNLSREVKKYGKLLWFNWSCDTFWPHQFDSQKFYLSNVHHFYHFSILSSSLLSTLLLQFLFPSSFCCSFTLPSFHHWRFTKLTAGIRINMMAWGEWSEKLNDFLASLSHCHGVNIIISFISFIWQSFFHCNQPFISFFFLFLESNFIWLLLLLVLAYFTAKLVKHKAYCQAMVKKLPEEYDDLNFFSIRFFDSEMGVFALFWTWKSAKRLKWIS